MVAGYQKSHLAHLSNCLPFNLTKNVKQYCILKTMLCTNNEIKQKVYCYML